VKKIAKSEVHSGERGPSTRTAMVLAVLAQDDKSKELSNV